MDFTITTNRHPSGSIADNFLFSFGDVIQLTPVGKGLVKGEGLTLDYLCREKFELLSPP